MKNRSRAPLYLRFAGRVTATLVALVIFALIAIQFARVIDQNVALAHELSSTNDTIASLQARRAHQLREIRRLSEPEGSIPEIHDRLRLVAPNEVLIFVSPAPAAKPQTER